MNVFIDEIIFVYRYKMIYISVYISLDKLLRNCDAQLIKLEPLTVTKA